MKFDFQKSYFVNVLPYIDTDNISVRQLEQLMRAIDNELHVFKAEVYLETQRKTLHEKFVQLQTESGVNLDAAFNAINRTLAD